METLSTFDSGVEQGEVVDGMELSEGSVATAAVAWRRSTRCDGNQCTEVAQLPNGDGVAVRDSTMPEQELQFDQDSWRALTLDMKRQP